MKGFNEIQALLGQEFDPTDPDYQYAKYEWVNNLNDKNNNDYSTGLVEIDTIGVSDGKWLDYHNAYITAPISIFGQTEMLTARPDRTIVAVKNSVTQLIYSIKIALGANSFILQNSDNVNLYNHIKAMVNDDVNYAATNGTFFHQAKDTTEYNDVDEYEKLDLTYAVGPPIAVTTTFLKKNVLYNKGFKKRVELLAPYLVPLPSDNTKSYFKFTACIPLKLISDFFDRLEYPLLDTRLVMSLGISGTSSFPNVFPFMADTPTNTAVANLKFSIGNDTVHINEQACKLWVAKVEFTPKVKTLIAQALLDGRLTKEVTFYNSKVVKNSETAAKTGIDFQLSNGIKDPKRVWTVIYERDMAKSAVRAEPCVTAEDASIDNVNITVNGDKFFESNVRYDHQFYKLFKDQQFNEGDDYQNGSLVDYADFHPTKGIHKYYCLDISSKTNHLADPLKPVILQIQMDVIGAKVYQIYHIIEHEVSVVIDMKLSQVSAPLSAV